VLVRTQDLQQGRLRQVYSLGLRIVLAGPDGGFGLGFGLWAESIPDLREPVVSTPTAVQALLDELEHAALDELEDRPSPPPRWDLFWHASEAGEPEPAIIQVHQLGLYLRTADRNRRFGVGWSSSRYLTRSVLGYDVVLMTNERTAGHHARSVILWRPIFRPPSTAPTP